MTRKRPQPTVGGQDARHIYGVIEAMPMSVEDGQILLDVHLCRTHAPRFLSAYQRVEKEVMVGMLHCDRSGEHGSISDGEWRYMIIHAMADEARRKLGIRSPHPFWC